jgi:hypothetical protein
MLFGRCGCCSLFCCVLSERRLWYSQTESKKLAAVHLLQFILFLCIKLSSCMMRFAGCACLQHTGLYLGLAAHGLLGSRCTLACGSSCTRAFMGLVVAHFGLWAWDKRDIAKTIDWIFGVLDKHAIDCLFWNVWKLAAVYLIPLCHANTL